MTGSLFLLAAAMVMATASRAWASVPVPIERVPEPATGLIVLAGLAGGAVYRHLKKR